MQPILFWLNHLQDLPLYFPILGISLLLHWLIFRKFLLGILDPLFFLLIGFAFNVSTLFFVAIFSPPFALPLVPLFLMQLLYYLGFCLIAPKNIQICKLSLSALQQYPNPTRTFDTSFLLVSIAVYFLANLLEYALAGIPLLRVSRQNPFSGTGLGVIIRFQSVCGILATLFFARLFTLRRQLPRIWKFFGFSLFCFLILAAALSGSKSAILSIVSIVSLFTYLRHWNENLLSRTVLSFSTFLLLLFLFFSAFLTQYVQAPDLTSLAPISANRVSFALLGIFQRFLDFGDIYIFSYANNTLENIPSANGIHAILSGPLSAFRLFSQDQIPIHLGLAIAQDRIPGLDYVAGPNANFNVLFIHYFGIFPGLILSFILGSFAGYCRRLFLFSSAALLHGSRGISSLAFYLVGFTGFSVGVDPVLFSSNFTSIFIVFPAIAFLSFPLNAYKSQKEAYPNGLESTS